MENPMTKLLVSAALVISVLASSTALAGHGFEALPND